MIKHSTTHKTVGMSCFRIRECKTLLATTIEATCSSAECYRANWHLVDFVFTCCHTWQSLRLEVVGKDPENRSSKAAKWLQVAKSTPPRGLNESLLEPDGHYAFGQDATHLEPKWLRMHKNLVHAQES